MAFFSHFVDLIFLRNTLLLNNFMQISPNNKIPNTYLLIKFKLESDSKLFSNVTLIFT